MHILKCSIGYFINTCRNASVKSFVSSSSSCNHIITFNDNCAYSIFCKKVLLIVTYFAWKLMRLSSKNEKESRKGYRQLQNIRPSNMILKFTVVTDQPKRKYDYFSKLESSVMTSSV